MMSIDGTNLGEWTVIMAFEISIQNHLLHTSQVQPDMEELTENVEEVGADDTGDSKEPEKKLGRLQYKVSLPEILFPLLLTNFFKT